MHVICQNSVEHRVSIILCDGNCGVGAYMAWSVCIMSNNNNNGWNGSFLRGWLLIEERRRWPVITASPRGQCSK